MTVLSLLNLVLGVEFLELKVNFLTCLVGLTGRALSVNFETYLRAKCIY